MRMKNYEISRQFFAKKIEERKLFAARCKERNEIYNSLVQRRERLREILSDIKEYLKELELIKDSINREDVLFKNSRITFLNSIITNRIKELFPNEDLEAVIEYNDKNRNTKAVLYLIDGNGNKRIPKISEGKFLQYAIGYTAVDGVLRNLGKNIIYIDEAFSVASESNLANVGEILKNSVESGMQIILVSQKSELYQSISHREIRMQKDPKMKRVVIDEIVDI